MIRHPTQINAWLNCTASNHTARSTNNQIAHNTKHHQITQHTTYYTGHRNSTKQHTRDHSSMLGALHTTYCTIQLFSLVIHSPLAMCRVFLTQTTKHISVHGTEHSSIPESHSELRSASLCPGFYILPYPHIQSHHNLDLIPNAFITKYTAPGPNHHTG